MCFDEFVCKRQLVEQEVTNLMVRQITLQTMFYALQIRDDFDFIGHLLSR